MGVPGAPIKIAREFRGPRESKTVGARYSAGLSVFWPGFILACFWLWAMYIFTWSACGKLGCSFSSLSQSATAPLISILACHLTTPRLNSEG